MNPLDTDDELETALVSAFLWATNPNRRHQAAVTATPAHFLHGRNRTLWEHLTRLHHAGQPVDTVTLIDSLDRAGHLEHVGGIVAVHEATETAPPGGDPTGYAERVAARARRRHAHTAAADLAAALAAADADVDATINAGVADILNAGRTPTAATVNTVGLAEAADALWRDGADTGWTSGWANLDGCYRPTHGQLTVVTGIPNAGKTTWLNAYLARLAHRHDHRYLMFSPEQSTTAKHVRNLTVVHGGPGMSPDVRSQSQQWVLDHFEWIDHRATRALGDIISAARAAHARRPFHGLVVDPWNWLEATRPTWMTETEFVGYALNDLIRVAQDLRVHVWVVAHPRKVDQFRDGRYDVARPYDIAGSANWFNKPWFCLSLWRDHLAAALPVADPDRDPSVVAVHVQKARDDDQGRIGTAELRMHPATRRYAPLSTERKPL